MNNRPAPRRALRAIAVALALSPLRRLEVLAMHGTRSARRHPTWGLRQSAIIFATALLMLTLIIPVSATSEAPQYIDIYDETSDNSHYTSKSTYSFVTYSVPNFKRDKQDLGLIIHRDIGDITRIIFGSSSITTTSPDRVDQTSVDFYYNPAHDHMGDCFPQKINRTYYVGSGTIYIYSNSETNQGHMTFIMDNWDSSVYAAHPNEQVYCHAELSRNLNFSTIKLRRLPSTYYVITDGNVAGLYASTGSSMITATGDPTYVYVKGDGFRQKITYYKINNDFNAVEVSRVVDDIYYQSTVTVSSHQKTEPYFVDDTGSNTVVSWFPTNETPYDISVYSPVTTKTYNHTVFGGADPGDPGDSSRVMVHIIAQDARTENLLLDAAVEVRDQNDAVVATGTTSPNGWLAFEYDLPATLADEDFQRYYTVNITLPGWTQKVTNYKFYPAFIPRSGDWIRVEMLPDTDGPADPEKTYIMFFVRDIHANPLERASIEIAGQYWHTNSAGHVAVEVPKNSTTAYTVRKTGHVSISGSAAVGAEGSYVVNIALGPALPDRTPGPGDDPGATPPPRDTRTNEEKGKAVIDLLADNAELIATLAILAAVMGLINLIMPGRRRR